MTTTPEELEALRQFISDFVDAIVDGPQTPAEPLQDEPPAEDGEGTE